MVYFIFDQEYDLVKIGFTSRDPHRRLAEHEAKCGRSLVLIKAIKGGRSLEKRLHARFRDDKIVGEYFRPSRHIQSFLGWACLPKPDPWDRGPQSSGGRKSTRRSESFHR